MAKQKPLASSEVIVRNHRKGTVRLPGIGTLKPGANIVAREAVELAKKLTTDAEGDSNIPAGVVTIEDGKPSTAPERTESEAIELVKDTFDLDMLRAWQADEKRPRVHKAISDQIDEMLKEPEGAGEGDEDK